MSNCTCNQGVFSSTEHNCFSQQNPCGCVTNVSQQCNCACTTASSFDFCQQDQECGCISEYSGSCIRYDGEELTNTNIPVGLNFNELIKAIDDYFLTFRNEIDNFITIINLGNGVNVYRDDNLLGQKQLRSLLSDNTSFTIVENSETINFNILQATETNQGIAQIATQVEADAGIDDEKIITPAKLNTTISNPSNLPNATEAQRGVIELATQAEVDAGTDTERAVTPSTLQQSITTILSDPTNLPDATEAQRGVIELATQAEVDAGTDTERAVTPATLSANVTSIVSDPSNLPNATETQRGVIEIATQAEVDAGTDMERAVTPATLVQSLTNNSQFNIPLGLITMWSGSPTALPTGWSICDGTNGTPDLRGRFIVGFDLSNPDYNSIGDTGGEESNVLDVTNLPEHDHFITNQFVRSDHSEPGDDGRAAHYEGLGGDRNTASQEFRTGMTGNSTTAPIENRPPFYTLAFIMYTG